MEQADYEPALVRTGARLAGWGPVLRRGASAPRVPCFGGVLLVLFAGATAEAQDDTWVGGAAQVVHAHCASCHHVGGPGPMALVTYDQVRPWGKAIARQVQNGRMPPWHAVAGGEFSNDRRLDDAERELLLRWVAGGMARGEGVVELPEFEQGWRIGEPDLVIEMPEVVTVPASGELPYHDYLVDPGFTEDVWVKAAESRPGNSKVVHHIIVGYLIEDPLARRRLAAQGQEGRVQGSLGGYVPGDEPLILEPGLARLIPKGSKIYFQMHYTPNGEEQTDRSRLGLVFADGPPNHEVKTGIASSPFIRIPAGSEDTSLSATFRFTSESVLLSMRPHMHLRGKTFEYRVRYPDASEEVLLKVDDYDFGWQTNYMLQTPKVLPAGTELICTGSWDNTAANPNNPDAGKTASWGQQTDDEMMIGFFEYYHR